MVQVITVGDVTGIGDALMINDQADRELDLRSCRRRGALDPLVAAAAPHHRLPARVHRGPGESKPVDRLDFFSGNDPTKAVFPIFSQPKNRRPEPMQHEIVDRALVGLSSDPPR